MCAVIFLCLEDVSAGVLLIFKILPIMKLGYLLAFGGGAVVAGLAMMLLAPRSGEEACVNFRRRMEDMKRCVGDAVEEALKKQHEQHGKSNAGPEVVSSQK